MAERLSFANLGAEEGARPSFFGEGSPVHRLAQHFEATVQKPPWRALAQVQGMIAWMNTDEAVNQAERLGLPLWGAPAAVVRQVHDKGFAIATAVKLGLVDDALAGTLTVLAPHELQAALIEDTIGRWPPWARAQATLKPRWGTSGRGRVAVRGGVLDERARNGLAGLAARGGAILEPWLERVLDLSSQWLVLDDDAPRLLGCTRMITRRSGVWLGCEVHGGDDGQSSGTAWDGQLVAAARPLVQAAADAGYRGVCGVDAFTWHNDGVERLRGVVELNARFTGGLIALASLHGIRGRASFRIQD